MENNEALVSEAFSKQSGHFDVLNKENKLTDHLRHKFRKEVSSHLKNKSKILELNGGTGIDALYFASLGHSVLVTDNAPGMLSELDKKIKKESILNVSTLRCSFHDLTKKVDGKFDHIISNFGGLNCTSDLKNVLQQLSPLLNDGGKITLVIMPKICPWELLMVLRGKFKTAFRRFKKHTPAHIDGTHFYCYYYSPDYVVKALTKDFKTVSLKGIFITVPPDFYLNFIERYPRLYKLFSKIDSRIEDYFPFTNCCDHFMITMEKKSHI